MAIVRPASACPPGDRVMLAYFCHSRNGRSISPVTVAWSNLSVTDWKKYCNATLPEESLGQPAPSATYSAIGPASGIGPAHPITGLPGTRPSDAGRTYAT